MRIAVGMRSACGRHAVAGAIAMVDIARHTRSGPEECICSHAGQTHSTKT